MRGYQQISIVICASVMFCVSAPAHSQETGKVQNAPKDSSLVRFSFAVHDEAGDFVSNLLKDDFQVSIDGKPAQIISLSELQPISPKHIDATGYLVSQRERAKENLPSLDPPVPPRNIFLLFDAEGLSQTKFENAVAYSRAILERVVLPWDRVFVYWMDSGLFRIAGPVTEKEDLLARIEHEATSIQTSQPHQSTRIENALKEIIGRSRSFNGRSAIIVFTDQASLDEENAPGSKTEPETQQEEENELERIEIQEHRFSVASSDLSDLNPGELINGGDRLIFLIDCSTQDYEAENPEADIDDSKYGAIFSGYSPDVLAEKLFKDIGFYYRIECLSSEQHPSAMREVELEFSVKLPFEITHPHRVKSSAEPPSEPITEANIQRALTEDFTLTAGSDLPVRMRLVQLPVGTQWGALILSEIPANNLSHSSDEPFELERIISVKNNAGQRIFYSHRHYLAEADQPLPPKIWILDRLPLADAGGEVRLLLRDVNGGQLFTSTMMPERNSGAEIQLGEPIVLNDPIQGNVETWHSAEIDDGIEAEIPLNVSIPFPPGALEYSNTVEQGGYSTLYLLINNATDKLILNTSDVIINYVLEYDENIYILQARNQRLIPLSGGKTLALIAEVPLGFAQESRSELSIKVRGLLRDVESVVNMPFIVLNFDEGHARTLLESEVIQPIMPSDILEMNQ